MSQLRKSSSVGSQKLSSCGAPQLQIVLVVCPRNQLYLDHEVAGIDSVVR